MRILILSFYYTPDLCPGSFRCSAFVDELRDLVPNDCQIDIITTSPNRYATFQTEAKSVEEFDGLTIHRINLPSHKSGMFDQAYAFIYFIKSTLRLIRIKNYDLVFATSSRLMTAALGTYIAKKKNAKLYLDIRDLFAENISNILPAFLSRIIKPILSRLEKWSFRRAHHINLISLGFKEYFLKNYAHIPCSHFTNGVDYEFQHLESTNVNMPFGVLYAGNIGEGQGLHLILPQLAKAMQGIVQFKVIGDGGRLSQLFQEIKEYNCKNIIVSGPISRKELIKEYQQADILFLHLNNYPAFQKVLPSKIFEYAATGKPIWAGVSGHAADFIKNEVINAQIFQPCNIQEAMESFSKLDIKSQQRQEFIDKYSRQNIMRKMAKEFLSLAEG